MSLPILQPTTNTIQIRGDVRIDDSAIVAEGVILNAPHGATIIIHSGVCLGMGTIITAYPNSTIEIKPNAIVGAGCLIFGQCIIGNQVSLGSCVTIYNSNIDNLAVIPSGSVQGDASRQVNQNNSTPQDESPSPEKVANLPLEDDIWQEKSTGSGAGMEEVIPEKEQDLKVEKVENKSDAVVGQVYINRLLLTLFPEKNHPL